MKYLEFKRQLGKAGLSVKRFAEIVKQQPNSITNYSKLGEVPTHLAIIAILMAHMADNGLDYECVLENVSFERNKARGISIQYGFNDTKTE